MSDLIDHMRRDIRRLGYKEIKILFYNPNKERGTCLVESKGKFYIFKWNNPDNPEFCNALKREIEFYLKYMPNEYVPQMIGYEEHILILEYISGVSLRDFILRNGDTLRNCNIINQLLEFCSSLYQPSKVQQRKNIELDIYFAKSLMYSGPMGTEMKQTRLERTLARILFFINQKKVSALFESLENSADNFYCQIHGDLHLNNILINKELSKIKIIDWESHRKGNALIELAYCYAMIWAIMGSNEMIYHMFSDYVNDNLSIKDTVFRKYCVFYCCCISVNRRYFKDRKLTQSLKSLMKWCLYINNRKESLNEKDISRHSSACGFKGDT